MSDEQRKESLSRLPATPAKHDGPQKLAVEETPVKTPAVNLTHERPTLHRTVESHLKKSDKRRRLGVWA